MHRSLSVTEPFTGPASSTSTRRRLHDRNPKPSLPATTALPSPGQRCLPDRYAVRAAGARRQPPGRRQRPRRVRRHRPGSGRSRTAAPRARRRWASAREQVDYLFLTHVHLDHAGGAGQLMQALPNAQAVLHPRGAPHMVDPAKLIAGSIEVYGEAMFRELYGELLPVPAERCAHARTARDCSSAHARSNSSMRPVMRGITIARSISTTATFTAGDNFGISLPRLRHGGRPVRVPDDDAGAVRARRRCTASIDRLLSYRPRRIAADAFRSGRRSRAARRATCTQSVDEFVRIARRHAPAADRTDAHRGRHVRFFRPAARCARLHGRRRPASRAARRRCPPQHAGPRRLATRQQ